MIRLRLLSPAQTSNCYSAIICYHDLRFLAESGIICAGVLALPLGHFFGAQASGAYADVGRPELR